MSGQCEQILKILQVLQKRAQVAVQRGEAAFGQCEQVVPSWLGNGLPVALPSLVRPADREGHGSHQARSALQPCEATVAKRQVEGFGADIDPAVDREPTAAAYEIGIGGDQVGEAREAIGRGHSFRMYSIDDPSEASKRIFTQRPRSSNP